MNKKDYKEIAKIVVRSGTLNKNSLNKSLLIIGLVDYFDKIGWKYCIDCGTSVNTQGYCIRCKTMNNYNFDRRKFLKDCGIKEV